MGSDKSEDISNHSLEQDSDTYNMDDRQPNLAQQRLTENSDSSGTPVYAGHADNNQEDNAVQQQQLNAKVSGADDQSAPKANEQDQALSQQSPASPQYISFFSRDYKPHRRKIHKRFLLINLLMSSLILIAFSIYWGSYYDINDNLKNLKFLVVIGDEQTVDGVEPVFGNAMDDILQRPQAKASGDWHIYKESEFENLANEHNNTIRGEILRRVHHQLYWSAIYVKPNASYNYVQALKKGDTSYNASDNTVTAYYETGRDFLAMRSYVTPQLSKIQSMWFEQQPNLLSQLSENITIQSQQQKQLYAQPIHFTMVDRIPFTDNVLSAPLQVGFIYMIIVSFFQFNFFADAHLKVAKSPINRLHYVVYRYISSICSFFFLSLMFGLVTLAFQVDFTPTYGRSGFLVYWCISFLTMSAVGLATEIMGMFIIPFYPPLLGFWLILWVISNIAPTYTAMALTNNFFRYGYAMPIHNSYEAVKTVFFDVYKGQLGRNFGILVAWVVLLSVIFPFAVMYFGKAMGKKAAVAAQQEAAKRAESEKKTSGDV
ncbi:hypothetical protein KGF57_002674 [Candida theae]|uniref:DUF3533 domain-containing protein n=1 Tax=Candida theae TaxID=1198502 RepID=A0AAD5FYQ1_9ASCO|nr:uncharacterized protein KGF57_002674 [Candida theae]KAI5958319.1 hypothetical protein KGF57_002674 [Candida theae]